GIVRLLVTNRFAVATASTAIKWSPTGPNTTTLLTTAGGPSRQSVRTMLRKSKQTEEEWFFETKPFPYQTRTYTALHRYLSFLDPTEARMNSNSKIVVVDGNIGSGKERVARELAAAFGLCHIQEPNIESLCVNAKGFDYRTLNKYIHPRLHAIDDK